VRECATVVWQCAMQCGSARQCAQQCVAVCSSVRQCGSVRQYERQCAAARHCGNIAPRIISEAQKRGYCAVCTSYNIVYHQLARRSKRGDDACCTIVHQQSARFGRRMGDVLRTSPCTLINQQDAALRKRRVGLWRLLMDIASKLVQKKAGAGSCVVYTV
jgi:hypothetical protein